MSEVYKAQAASCDDGSMHRIHVLLLGEGDLTFSYALVRKLARSKLVGRLAHSSCDESRGGKAASHLVIPSMCHFSSCHVLVSTFDTLEQVVRKYPRAVPILQYFSTKTRIDVRHLGGIDATRVVDTLRRADYDGTLDFDVVIFNNPHVGYEDLYRQWALLSHFFASMCFGDNTIPALSTSGTRQVVVALSDDQPRRWGLLRAARASGYCCIAAVPVLPLEFREYDPRRHQSDSTFRSHCVIQYYFVPYTSYRVTMDELHTVFAAYTAVFSDDGRSRVQHVDSGAWNAEYHRLTSWFAEESNTEVRGACASSRERTSTSVALGDVIWDALSAGLPHDASWFTLPEGVDFTYSVPLLHPHLAFHTGIVPWVAAQCDINENTLHLPCEERYSPQVPVRVLPDLYRRQLHHILASDVETEGRVSHFVSSPADDCDGAAGVPPHLDPTQLGRALTTREQAKVARYRARFCRQEVKHQRNCAVSYSSTATVFCCSLCSPSRAFSTPCDLEQHMRSRHGEVDVLHPNMHARAHRQIVRDMTLLTISNGLTPHGVSCAVDTNADVPAGVEGTYCFCDICELVFKDAEAFQEHLQCLTPNDAAAQMFICEQCSPPSHFVDRRALAQHTARLHSLAQLPRPPPRSPPAH